MRPDDLVLELLARFAEEGVDDVLVGGQAVPLDGFVRSTENVDALLPRNRDNGERAIRALDFLTSSAELDPDWFSQEDPEGGNIATFWCSTRARCTKIPTGIVCA